MKKILSYCMLLMLACLTFSSCEKGKFTPKNELDGTVWTGVAALTTVTVSFVGDECRIVLTGYANGSAVGSYTIDASNVSVTITGVSGSSDGQLQVGDVINGTFDLSTKKMTVSIALYGRPYQITLDKSN